MSAKPYAGWVGMALAAGALAGGCAGTPAVPAAPVSPAPPAVVHQKWPGCAALGAFRQRMADNPTPGAGSIPPGFVPTAAISCQSGERRQAGGDTLQVNLERRATAIGPLIYYLSQPSRLPSYPEQQACPAMGWLRPWLFLTDRAGRWTTPALPTDACGYPLGFFTARGPAYRSLRFHDTVIKAAGTQ